MVTAFEINKQQIGVLVAQAEQEGSQPKDKAPIGQGIIWQHEGLLGWKNFVPDHQKELNQVWGATEGVELTST